MAAVIRRRDYRIDSEEHMGATTATEQLPFGWIRNRFTGVKIKPAARSQRLRHTQVDDRISKRTCTYPNVGPKMEPSKGCLCANDFLRSKQFEWNSSHIFLVSDWLLGATWLWSCFCVVLVWSHFSLLTKLSSNNKARAKKKSSSLVTCLLYFELAQFWLSGSCDLAWFHTSALASFDTSIFVWLRVCVASRFVSARHFCAISHKFWYTASLRHIEIGWETC